eukprot:SAG11_NODE_2356_length_3467_cov_3.166518_1_plen_395_part_00
MQAQQWWAPVLSCRTPHGASRDEAPVDCAAAGLEAIGSGLFAAERDCAGGECGVQDCCVAADCHDAPGWISIHGFGCESMARNGRCARTEPDYCHADGVCPADACCSCGAPSTGAPVMSCATPHGASWDEAPVDCAAAGLAALPSFLFEAEQDCAGGECGLEECCVAADCHDLSASWRASRGSNDCDDQIRNNDCARTDPHACNAAGVCAAEACCGCGAPSMAPFMSCATPRGASWDEAPVDCAAAGLEAIAPSAFAAERGCAGAACGLEECCVAADCHDAPGWIISTLDVVQSEVIHTSVMYEGGCDEVVKYNVCGFCDDYRHDCTDNVSAFEACCGCGAGAPSAPLNTAAPSPPPPPPSSSDSSTNFNIPHSSTATVIAIFFFFFFFFSYSS